MRYIKYFTLGVSIGLSGLVVGPILVREITLFQKRIEIIFTKK